MARISLTERAERIDGRLVHRYAWRGRCVPVCDSMRDMLLVIELFGDDGLGDRAKSAILPRMLFPASELAAIVRDAGDGLADLIATVIREACGLDVSGDAGGERVFDWDEDAERISASVSMAYGQQWDEFADTHSYREGCALLGALLETTTPTPFREAVMYRVGKPPEDPQAAAAWRDAARHYALGGDAVTADRMEREAAKAGDIFAALERRAAHV